MTLVKRDYNNWNNLFEDVLGNLTNGNIQKDLNVPPVNVLENNDEFQLQVAAPGLQKQDFKLKVDDNLLTVSYEKETVENEKGGTNESKFHRQEFSSRSFKRTFTLDEKIDAEKIAAKYDNGILYITLPKKDEVKQAPKSIEIL
ncbi:MAG TPA: Hsp20/alpha crystallin family protein [Arachidicoccus sp.]|nr:Hsp20/alpha crystallin family protein [Arachidicoccus sp.]